MPGLIEMACNAKIYDLGQPYFVGMPHYPLHPPFLFSLVKQHGDYVGPIGNSSASESIALGGHVGTHIDALNHFSCAGKIFGGDDAAPLQSYAGGVRKHSIDTVPPILRRGVLLDIAPGETLPADFEITPAYLDAAVARQRVEIRSGDVVLLRTGWAAYWRNPARYINEVRSPGPALEGARWLSSRGVFAAGSDTVAFEKVPDPTLPVHVHLIVENGIHIIECLNLEDLAAARVYEFLFIASPLKLEGGTASPIRPLAVAE